AVVKQLAELHARCSRVLTQPARTVFGRASFLIFWGWFALALARLLVHFLPTAEGPLFDWVFRLGFAIFAVFLVSAFFQFWHLWRRLRKLLEQAALLPMAEAFDRLPAKIASGFGPYLSSLRPRLSRLAVPVQQWSDLAKHYPDVRSH